MVALGKPKRAIRPCCDSVWLAKFRRGEFGYLTSEGDPPDLPGGGIGEPQIAVRPCGDAWSELGLVEMVNWWIKVPSGVMTPMLLPMF
jgi:hypothetical protein